MVDYRPSWYRRAYPFDAVGRKKMQDLLVEAGSVPSVPISESSGCDLGHMPASFGQLVHLTLHHMGSMDLGER